MLISGQHTPANWLEVPAVDNHVKKYRKAAKLTLEQLAELSGVAVSTIDDIEHGAEPHVIVALRIAKALNTKVELLWEI